VWGLGNVWGDCNVRKETTQKWVGFFHPRSGKFKEGDSERKHKEPPGGGEHWGKKKGKPEKQPENPAEKPKRGFLKKNPLKPRKESWGLKRATRFFELEKNFPGGSPSGLTKRTNKEAFWGVERLPKRDWSKKGPGGKLGGPPTPTMICAICQNSP